MEHRKLERISIHMAVYHTPCLTCLTRFGQSSARASWALVASFLRRSTISRVRSSLIRLQSSSSQLGWSHATQIFTASSAASFVASSPCFSNSSVRNYELVVNTFLNSQVPNSSTNLYNGFGHRVNVTQGDVEDFKFHFCRLCG